jgi:hypothetical protein
LCLEMVDEDLRAGLIHWQRMHTSCVLFRACFHFVGAGFACK